MKFSTRDRYALRLMVELANRAGADALVPLKEISDAQQISLKISGADRDPPDQGRAGA